MLNDENNRKNYILIAEDNQDDIMLYQTAFNAMNIENKIVFAFNGAQALKQLKENPEVPFIIISDINMPLINGIELKEKIEKDTELKVKSVPFIFMTSSASPEEIYSAYELSAQGYFLKPMDYPSFEAIIRRIFEYWSEAQMPRVPSL